jgi:hypothetical protein
VANSNIASVIPGLQELWDITLGNEQILTTILDGECDRSHPSLAGAKLTQQDSLVLKVSIQGLATQLFLKLI